MRHISLLALVCAVLFWGNDARAVPMLSKLDTILASSTTIVIARYDSAIGTGTFPSGYDLVVERAIRGSVGIGHHGVHASPSGHAYMTKGTRIVAFVDGAGTWLAYARLAAGPSLEDGVLHVEGFNDFNAHVVEPGIMTLAQLEAYATKGTPLAWTFKGKLQLATSSGLAPSTIDLVASVPANTVTGMPAMAGFPAPTVRVGSWMGNDVFVSWQDTLGRPLRMGGTATGKNPDGSIAVDFKLDMPSVLTESDFRTYLASPKLGHPYYVVDVVVGGRVEQLVLEKEVGRIGTLGTSSGVLGLGETSMAPSRYIKTAGPVKLTLATTGYKATSRGTTGMLIEELMHGPIACTYETSAATPCTLRYSATKFTSTP